MTEYNAENPLEVEILRGISFLETGKNRLFCNVVVINPLKEDIFSEGPEGMVRGFKNTFSNHSFTRTYRENELVRFDLIDDGPHGVLRVGDEIYHIEAKGTTSDKGIIYEKKKFPNRTVGLRDYLTDLAGSRD